jgi:hypothetical protein
MHGGLSIPTASRGERNTTPAVPCRQWLLSGLKHAWRGGCFGAALAALAFTGSSVAHAQSLSYQNIGFPIRGIAPWTALLCHYNDETPCVAP